MNFFGICTVQGPLRRTTPPARSVELGRRRECLFMIFVSVSVLDVLWVDVDYRAVGFPIDSFGYHRVAEHAATEEAGLA